MSQHVRWTHALAFQKSMEWGSAGSDFRWTGGGADRIFDGLGGARFKFSMDDRFPHTQSRCTGYCPAVDFDGPWLRQEAVSTDHTA